jgi:DNA-binding transcriptional regulator PaaX
MTKKSTLSSAGAKAPAPAWLLFVLTLQGQQPALRMRVWRGLKALGAGVIRDGVRPSPAYS